MDVTMPGQERRNAPGSRVTPHCLGRRGGGGQKRTRPGGAPSSALQRQVTEYFRRRGRKRIHKLVLSIIFTRVNEIH